MHSRKTARDDDVSAAALNDLFDHLFSLSQMSTGSYGSRRTTGLSCGSDDLSFQRYGCRTTEK